jgi:hypothetical protein
VFFCFSVQNKILSNRNYQPSQGGNPYLKDMREEVITQYQPGFLMVTPESMALCEQCLYLSVPTCRKYIKQFHAEGHARPKYATGNCMAEWQVLGQHLVWLALYRIVHPEGTIAEAHAFLLNMDLIIALFSPFWEYHPRHLYDCDLVFVILKGISIIKFPKRFLEISCRDLTSSSLLLI